MTPPPPTFTTFTRIREITHSYTNTLYTYYLHPLSGKSESQVSKVSHIPITESTPSNADGRPPNTCAVPQKQRHTLQACPSGPPDRCGKHRNIDASLYFRPFYFHVSFGAHRSRMTNIRNG